MFFWKTWLPTDSTHSVKWLVTAQCLFPIFQLHGFFRDSRYMQRRGLWCLVLNLTLRGTDNIRYNLQVYLAGLSCEWKLMIKAEILWLETFSPSAHQRLWSAALPTLPPLPLLYPPPAPRGPAPAPCPLFSRKLAGQSRPPRSPSLAPHAPPE